MDLCRIWRVRQSLLLAVMLLALPFGPARFAPDAVYIVNSLADTNDGACSAAHCTLREAVQAANAAPGADTIQFLLNGTIPLSAPLPTILQAGGALTIDAAGRTVQVNGSGAHRILFVENRAGLTLQNLTLRDGYASYGGGIYNLGTLTLTNCTLANNRAMNQGGAIFSSGTLTLNDTTFTGNFVDVNSGGGVYINSGTARITGGVFQDNQAMFSGGAIYNRYESEALGSDLAIVGTNFLLNLASGGHGGAIANESDMQIDQATFGLNSAEENGGAIFNDTGGVYQITNSQFSFNASLFSHGGGLYTDNLSGASSLKNSTFSGNNAHLDGGGFYVQRGTAIFEQVRFSNNEAQRNGGGGFNDGGLVYLTADSFETNEAGQHGGAFYNRHNMNIRRCTFFSNTAVGNGGGVYHDSDMANVSIENSTFYANRADQGGGLFTVTAADVRNCTLSANTASAGEGGGIHANYLTYLRNTILAANTGGNCSSGSLPVNAGNNLDSGTSCGFGAAQGSISSADPRLGPLQDNGGPTKTMLPLAGSPVVDAVIYDAPNECPAEDQRGYTRPFGVRCDIGAVERYFRVIAPVIIR